ncbi:hypothetical protein AMS62_26415 [Bacillus sp. FJAT-18019]|nr:hypothetical protein AMS62_26415 [Bacillus sp. FJAT-18019]
MDVTSIYECQKIRELVELLVNAEQYIAEQNQNWIKSQFKSFKQPVREESLVAFHDSFSYSYEQEGEL